MVDERADEICVLAGVRSLDSLLERTENVVLAPLKLRRGESVASHPLDFGEEGPEGCLPLPVLERNVAECGLAGLAELARAEVSPEERSARLAGNRIETLGHYEGYQSLGGLREETDISAVVGFVIRIAPPQNLD